jgi:hypothetical protein
VFYGAAEFSRDTDLVIFSEASNLARLQDALDELRAVRIAVPPFEPRYLELGLAVHFRCQAKGVVGIRVDVMSKLRGVAAFAELWDRRHSIDVNGVRIDLLGLADLVRAKKTQRDKDWPMLARLLEADYAAHRHSPSPERIDFWLREMRTSELLVRLTAENADRARALTAVRPLLAAALGGDEPALRQQLRTEEDAERQADRQHWAPLKRELERLRREQRGTV